MQIRKGEKIPKLTPDMKSRWNYDRHATRINFDIRSHAKYNTVDDARKEFEDRERDIAKNMGLRGIHGGPRQRRRVKPDHRDHINVAPDIDAVAALAAGWFDADGGRG